MSLQSEVVTSEARKSGFFQPSMFQKEPGMTQKLLKHRFFDAKNPQESIGLGFKALSHVILAEMDNLC